MFVGQTFSPSIYITAAPGVILIMLPCLGGHMSVTLSECTPFTPDGYSPSVMFHHLCHAQPGLND